MHVTAVVLAGGRATRMGGTDKGLIVFAGQTLAARAAQRAAVGADRVVLSANRNFGEYGKLGLPIVQDALSGFLGPLTGVHAVMAQLQIKDADQAVATVPCDCPFFPENLLGKLKAALMSNPSANCAVARAQGVREPTFAMYRGSVFEQVQGYLLAGGRRLGQFLAEQGAIAVDFDSLREFDNLNTPEDLQKAEGEEKSFLEKQGMSIST